MSPPSPPAEPGSSAALPLYAPLVLLANRDEVFRDSIATVLTRGGFRVVTAESGARTLERAREQQPDAIILDVGFHPRLPDAYAVCRALRSDPAVSPATPIVLTTPGPVLRAQQLEALRHGAWELRGDPLDTEELSLRLSAYVQGKLEADRVREAGLLDRASGLYNAQGLQRRAEELLALTTRHQFALACAVFTPALAVNGAIDRLARAFQRAGRRSDAIGRTGPAEFTVFAPATDATGAARLVRRLSAAVAQAVGESGATSPVLPLRTGYSAALPGSGLQSPEVLLTRAREALALQR